MKNTITNKIFERWKRGDRFHLLYRKDSSEKDIFIGSYEDCLKAAGRRYDFDKLPDNFFLIDITDDLIEQVTNAITKDRLGWKSAMLN